MPLITEPGIYPDISSADYFADPCPAPSLTQSIAKVLIEQSPLHAKYAHPRLCPPEQADDEEKYTAVQAIGNAAHAMLIGRGKELAAAPWDDWRTKEARAFRSEQARLGKTPILQKHMDEAHKVTLAARLQLVDAGWADSFKDGQGEVVVAWEEDGLWFRTMIDWLVPGMSEAYDLKTSGASYAPHVIARKMVDDGWDVQAAMHERALNAVDPDGAGRRKFRFVAIENYPPYALVPVEMTETWLTMGRKKLEHAIALWRGGMKTGKWPAYGADIQRPDYPSYKETEWLGRELEYAEREQERIPANILAAG